VLEFAVLGLLAESPLHGYELRKRLNAMLGTFRAFSYGSLYPTLRRMQARGWVTADSGSGRGGRSKVVYSLTADGKERFAELLAEAGPSAWEDETFNVHFSFFAQTHPDARLRILEGRRTRLEEKRERFRGAAARTRQRVDRYTLELQRHGLESVEREVRWLTELIETERAAKSPVTEAPSPSEPPPTTGSTSAPEPPGAGPEPADKPAQPSGQVPPQAPVPRASESDHRKPTS
jgi:DNA-binding PadR family transcriptional regulator